MYGRPLADELGPIVYRQVGDGWIAIHADGTQEPAPSVTPEDPFEPTAGLVSSGYSLDSLWTYQVGSSPYAAAIGDVTGDGHADVLMTTTSGNTSNDYSLFVFPQQASGTLGTPLKYPYLEQYSLTGQTGIAVADLNEDGVLDVVVGHKLGVTLFLADGQGNLRPGVVIYDFDASVLSATDVDRDGHMDIVSMGQSRPLTVLFGDGQGNFSRTIAVASNAHGFNDFETGDLNGDGLVDLAVLDGAISTTVNLSVHRNDGAGGFVSPPDTYLVDPRLRRAGVGVGDVTGDGLSDAVVSRPANRPTSLLIMAQDALGRLTGPTSIASYDIPEPVVVTDVDRDGMQDAVVAHGGWSRLGVYLQGPGGTLGAETLYSIPNASLYPPQSLAVGDFTSDGCPDVAIADSNGSIAVLHGHGCTPHCGQTACDDLNPCTDDGCDPSIGCVHTNNTNPCDDGKSCTAPDVCGDGQCHGGTNTCPRTLAMFTKTTGVTVFDADADTVVGSLSIGTPRDCSINAHQTLGFVVDGQNKVWVIDLTRTPPTLASDVNPIPISNGGWDTTISPDQKYLLVCGSSLSVVDIAARSEIATVSVPGGCGSVEVCPDGSVLATSSGPPDVYRYRIDESGQLSSTGEALRTTGLPVNALCAPRAKSGLLLARPTVVSFGMPGLVQVNHREPGGDTYSGAINRAGNRVFLRTINSVVAYDYSEATGSLGAIPLFSFSPGTKADASPGIDEIAIHPDGTKFYTLGDAPSTKLGVYNTSNGQKIGSISAGTGPTIHPKAVCFPSMECVPDAPLQCMDGNPCTDDTCDPVVGCVHVNNTAPCDDGNSCTTGDTCSGGTCRPGGPTNCDDGNCCTIDGCNPATGCVHTTNTTPPVFVTQPSLGNCPILWPPNHGYVDFTVADTGATAQAQCGISSIQFASCTSSQSENAIGTGDGNALRDCVYEPGALHLRAERNGACSPTGRVYETTLVAVDVCGNTTTSSALDVSVWHDRGHGPASGQIFGSSGDTKDVRDGTNGTYNLAPDACDAGGACANGTTQDHSDANPEMEISQQAAISVDTLRIDKVSGALQLSWIAPQPPAPIHVTRYHVYRLDPATPLWTQIAEIQDLSFTDPSLNDARDWQYKITAIVK